MIKMSSEYNISSWRRWLPKREGTRHEVVGRTARRIYYIRCGVWQYYLVYSSSRIWDASPAAADAAASAKSSPEEA